MPETQCPRLGQIALTMSSCNYEFWANLGNECAAMLLIIKDIFHTSYRPTSWVQCGMQIA